MLCAVWCDTLQQAVRAVALRQPSEVLGTSNKTQSSESNRIESNRIDTDIETRVGSSEGGEWLQGEERCSEKRGG
jgi:hypothetical protein